MKIFKSCLIAALFTAFNTNADVICDNILFTDTSIDSWSEITTGSDLNFSGIRGTPERFSELHETWTVLNFMVLKETCKSSFSLTSGWTRKCTYKQDMDYKYGSFLSDAHDFLEPLFQDQYFEMHQAKIYTPGPNFDTRFTEEGRYFYGTVTKNSKGYNACESAEVYAYAKPEITLQATFSESEGRIQGVIKATSKISRYSKSEIDNIAPTYDFELHQISRWNGYRCEVVEETSSWTPLKVKITSNQLSFDYYACEFQIRARVFDARSYSLWSHKTFRGRSLIGSSNDSDSDNTTINSSSGGSCSGSRCTNER